MNPPKPREVRGPELYAHWHGDEFLLMRAYLGYGLAVMSSKSRDGRWMGYILEKLGFKVSWGSSSRGGAEGLISMIRLVRQEKRDAALSVDGPRGPVYRVKPGMIKMAQKTGAPIIPVAGAAKRRFVFEKAWNKSYAPYPFSRCVMLYGEPMVVPKKLSEAELERYRLALEENLVALKGEAERYFERSFAVPKLQPAGV